MQQIRSSIQNKVRFGYYICISLIIVIAVLNYINLRTIDKKISFSFIISEFFDTALEMRRFEKNYFLYKEKKDYLANLKFTEQAENIIAKNKEAIKKLSPDTDVASIEKGIQEYKSYMQDFYENNKYHGSDETRKLELIIRVKGKMIVDSIERLSIAEKRYVGSLIDYSKKIIIASIILLVIIGVFIGQFFSLMVVRPLKLIEEHMQRIANGKFNRISVESSDREIVSLYNAYSRTIKELELRQMRFVLQSEKLASLGTMISGIAHELNNPLSNIYSSCQILNEEIESAVIEYKRDLLQQIEGEVERAKTMVHSLLEFSRKTEFKRKPYSLKYLIDNTLRLIHGDIPTKVEIISDIPEDSWVFVDKQRIQQAILNIIKNGIDAIPDEGRILITAFRDADNNKMVMKIEDTGIGMEPEKIGKIFDPFFTTKEEGMGSGLGLFITKEIIEEHEGEITVESRVDEGTTFVIKLPLKEN